VIVVEAATVEISEDSIEKAMRILAFSDGCYVDEILLETAKAIERHRCKESL
jgi:hypothetical protein